MPPRTLKIRIAVSLVRCLLTVIVVVSINGDIDN
jgi:hypothetical protein